MITFCLTCEIRAAGRCPGVDHPADCRKSRSNNVRAEMLHELATCCGVD